MTLAGLSYREPAGWSAVGKPPLGLIDLLGFKARSVIAPNGQAAKGMAIIGVVPEAVGRHLLKRSVLIQARGSTGATVVSIGSQYVGVKDEFQLRNIPDTLDVYSIHTAHTTVSVACIMPVAGWAASVLDACERITSTLLIGASYGEAVEASEGEAYYEALQRIIGRYGEIRRFLRRQLARGRLDMAQELLAGLLADLSSEVGERVAELRGATVPEAQLVIRAELPRLAEDYFALGRAAKAGDGIAYEAAAGKIGEADRSLAGALAEVASL